MNWLWPIRISWCTIADKQGKVEELASRASEIGYEGVELWGPHIEEYETRKGEVESLADTLEDLGVEVPAISVYFNWFTHQDPFEANLKLAERYIGYARVLKAPVLRAWVGPLGSAQMSAENWKQAGQGMKQLVELCSNTGITLAIETHRNQPMDTTNSTLKLLNLVGDDLKVVLDIYNLYQEGEEPKQVLEKLMPWICHIHAKNLRTTANGKQVTTLRDGDLDWDEFLAHLRSRGYDKWISIEYFGPEIWTAAAADLEYLRSYRAKNR